MEEIYKQIWSLALPYQDKRNDAGHAKTVLDYAKQLVKIENADENIVIPAAILHDIGWSKVPKEELLVIFGNISKEDKIAVKKKHEKYGVSLAREILNEVHYEIRLTDEILEIISGHDTRIGFISKNEGIVRDADKLWRFSKKGFWVDVKRHNTTFEKLYVQREEMMARDNFFYSDTARKIAEHELEIRRKEYSNHIDKI